MCKAGVVLQGLPSFFLSVKIHLLLSKQIAIFRQQENFRNDLGCLGSA